MQSSIIRAEKNAVGRALLKLVLENPNESLYTVHRGGWGDMKPAWDEKSKEVVYRRDPLSTLGDNVVAVKQDGKQYFIVFEDEGNLLARAFKNLGVEKSNIVVRTLASLNRYLAAINTSLNPDFVLSNFVRDLQTATINLVGEQDARGALREPQQMARRVLKDIPKAMRGAMLGLYDTDPTDPWVQAFDEFREAGGMINFYSMKDLDALREELLRMTEESSKQGFSPLRAARALGEHMSRLNGAVENAVRLSTYKNARDAGLSRDRAASLARNITVNFTRKGEFGNVGNALYLFYNASLQGSVRLLYAAAKSPRVQKILGGIAVSGFLWGLTLRLLAGDDDDGENRYDKIPDYIKTRNIVLWIDDDGAIWKWPLPYGYNVPWVFGTYMENVIAHPDRRGHGALVMAQALAESFNPLGGADSDDAYRWVAKVVSPTVTDPLLELALNEDFAGRPIRREQPDWGPPVPEHQLYWNSVSPLYRETTKVLSDLTGGNDIIPGAVDINPENVEYTVDFLTGGVGRSIRSLVEMPVKAIKGDEIRAGDIPVFRRFRGDPNEQYTWQRYDEIKDEVQLVVKREKALLEDASTRRDVPEYRKEHQTLLRLEPYVRQAESELNRLYKERRTIRNRDLPEDKRKEMTEAIDARIEAARKRLIKRYNDVRAQ